jgi:hypothetical protein
MSDTGWLVVALLAGAFFAVFWVKRELWIHRRRARRRPPERR